MGDNRPESSDSRIWGTLPRANIIGHVFLRLLPVQQLGVFPGSITTSAQ
jgi:signal peptidase I